MFSDLLSARTQKTPPLSYLDIYQTPHWLGNKPNIAVGTPPFNLPDLLHLFIYLNLNIELRYFVYILWLCFPLSYCFSVATDVLKWNLGIRICRTEARICTILYVNDLAGRFKYKLRFKIKIKDWMSSNVKADEGKHSRSDIRVKNTDETHRLIWYYWPHVLKDLAKGSVSTTDSPLRAVVFKWVHHKNPVLAENPVYLARLVNLLNV